MKRICISFYQSKSILLFVLFWCTTIQAQLSDFTLVVTPTNQTCTGNGTLTFEVNGATNGANFIYSVYLLPNTTVPLVTVTTSIVSGLNAGDYLVIATQVLNDQTNTQQANVTILNQIQPLSFQLTNQNGSCNSGSSITVNILTGTAVSYEIISGPIIFPPQSSNVFSGLVSGEYVFRVYDICGDAVVQTYTLIAVNLPNDLDMQVKTNQVLSSCDTVVFYQNIQYESGTIVYPLTIQFTIFPPNASPVVFDQVFTTGFTNSSIVTQTYTLVNDEVYNYTYSITDSCGFSISGNGIIAVPEFDAYSELIDETCNLANYQITFALNATIISAPDTYTTNPIPYDLPIGSGGYPITGPLSAGSYVVVGVNECNEPYELTIIVNPSNAQSPIIFVMEGCGIGNGSLNLNGANGFENVFIIAAPPGFPFPIPYDVSSNINNNGDLILTGLPTGNYSIQSIDTCGNLNVTVVTIQGYFSNTEFNLDENCGSFNLELMHTSNNFGAPNYWLQKYYPALNSWGHPGTGLPYVEGTPFNNTNAVVLSNNTNNLNLAYSGLFRVMKRYQIVSNGSTAQYCVDNLFEFEIDGLPRINQVFSFSCQNGLSDVIVDASGVAPLQYRIIQRNGQPFFVDNQFSNLFVGLQTGTYLFQVQDTCGNIRNAEFEIFNPFTFTITAFNLCFNQTAILSTPNFPFLNYRWWRSDNPSVILSTNNTLELPGFNPAVDNGIYHVEITNPSNPSSCINFELTYELSQDILNPQAGIGVNQSFCGSQNVLDLFSFLTGDFSVNGDWSEITTSGTLSENLWNTTNLPSGIYQFNYRVEGGCDTFSETQVEIQLFEVPQAPIIQASPIVCETGELQLFASTITNGTYNWVGPNGFGSNEQNPIIQNLQPTNGGTYSLTITTQECSSPMVSVDINISSLPQFSLNRECLNERMIVSMSIVQNSFVSSDVNFEWSGPNGFSSSESSIDITNGERGLYYLTVTTEEGCSVTQSIFVPQTICIIPRGVSSNNDGSNDAFDLSGFGEIRKVKIYNRYGRTVYELADYVDQWKGQDFNGNILPSATYYYYIEFPDGNAKTGWVYLTHER